MVIENNYVPIISQELWDKVHEIEKAVSTGKQTKKGVNSDKKRQKDIEKRITDLDKLIQKIYEDKVLGSLPEKTCADLLTKYQQEKDTLQTELDTLIQRADADKQDEADVDEYIRRLKSYTGAEELTRQMCLDLIEYFTVDAYQGRKAVCNIHIYYKLIDKPLKNKRNALEI